MFRSVLLCVLAYLAYFTFRHSFPHKCSTLFAVNNRIIKITFINKDYRVAAQHLESLSA